MTNTFIKPDLIVNSALGMLQDSLVLPNFVSLNPFATDFSGLLNDTITVRIELPTTADEFALRATGGARTLNTHFLNETTIQVTLDTNVYNAVPITDEEWTLDIESFALKVLARQVRAVRDRIEFKLSHLIQSADYSTVYEAATDGIYDAMVKAGAALNRQRVPKPGRVMIVGSSVYENLQLDDRFTRYDSAGQAAPSALQDAIISRVAGNTIVQVDTIPNGAAYLFHPTAFIMVSRSPKSPLSLVRGADAGQDGIAMRWLSTYSQDDWADLSVLNTYCGFSTVVDPAYTDDFGTKGDGFVRGTRIQLTPTTAGLEILNEGVVTAATGANHTRQLGLTDDYGDNRTAEATWVSSDPTKATVSSTGLVTGVATGSTTITSTVDGVAKTWALTVAT